MLLLLACDLDGEKSALNNEEQEASEGLPGVQQGEEQEEKQADVPLVCEDPSGCISLAEAYDKGDALLSLSSRSAIQVENIGQQPICLDSWNTYLGTGTQDGIAGFRDPREVQSGEVVSLFYDKDIFQEGFDQDWGGWWCIEHNQYTAGGEIFEFIGAEAPPSLLEFVVNRTDVDEDGEEDHSDSLWGSESSSEGVVTQELIWDKVATEPVVIVGRTQSYFALREGESATVTLQAINIGRVFSYGAIEEIVPAGLAASDFSVAPAKTEALGDGSVRYTWAAKLEPAIDSTSPYEPSTYAAANISYTITMESCQGRIIGYAPSVSWSESDGMSWTGYGSALIAECCQ
jgi:hypothetical protein